MNGTPGRFTMRLPKDPPAARTARSALEEWLPTSNPRLRDAALHIVTELVANGVRYGRPPIQLTVAQLPDRLWIEVTDGGTGTPERREPGDDGGWGLEIVEGLADRWGLAGGGPGVWCELEGRQAPSP